MENVFLLTGCRILGCYMLLIFWTSAPCKGLYFVKLDNRSGPLS